MARQLATKESLALCSRCSHRRPGSRLDKLESGAGVHMTGYVTAVFCRAVICRAVRDGATHRTHTYELGRRKHIDPSLVCWALQGCGTLGRGRKATDFSPSHRDHWGQRTRGAGVSLHARHPPWGLRPLAGQRREERLPLDLLRPLVSDEVGDCSRPTPERARCGTWAEVNVRRDKGR